MLTHPSTSRFTRVLSEDDAAAKSGLSKDTFRRLVAKGEGPQRVRLSERRVGYPDRSLEEWILSRVEQPQAYKQK